MDVAFENSGVVVAPLVETEEIAALLRMFEGISVEEGWQPGNQLRAYLSASNHFAVQVDGELAGGLQVVLPGADGRLPCSSVWPEVDIAADGRPAHVTILALRPEYRGRHGLFWPLCVELWRWCVAEHVKTVVLEATPIMLERYRRVGWPLSVIGERRIHWGEECLLCRMQVDEVAGSLLARALRSAIYRPLILQAIRSGRSARCASPSTLP
jgi:hypothetical protein